MSHFEFTDPDGDKLLILPGPAADGTPAVGIAIELGDTPFGVVVPLARLEEVIAGLRDMARQAGTQPEAARCTCARAWNLHSQDCARYLDGHELINPASRERETSQ